MGQGIDNWASLRAACEKYGTDLTVPALVAELERQRDVLAEHIATDRAHMHCPMRARLTATDNGFTVAL